MNAVSDSFSEGDWIIYPKHGLGKTLGFEKQVFSESEVEFIVSVSAPMLEAWAAKSTSIKFVALEVFKLHKYSLPPLANWRRLITI